MTRRSLIAFLLGLLLPVSAPAQYRSRRSASGRPSVSPAPLTGITITFHGALKKLSKKEILLESDDKRIITLRRSGKTKFFEDDKAVKASQIDLETIVSIDASEDNDLKLLALNVKVDSEPKKTMEK